MKRYVSFRFNAAKKIFSMFKNSKVFIFTKKNPLFLKNANSIFDFFVVKSLLFNFERI